MQKEPSTNPLHPQEYSTVICAHSSCPDGTACAWILLKKFPNAYVHFARERDFDKDENMPDLAGKSLIIADWSYPAEVLLRLAAVCRSVTVIDHHETARVFFTPEVAQKCEVRFDVLKCGAELCAEYVFASKSEHPWWVQHIRDRDLFVWEHPKSKAFSAAFFNYGLKVDSLTKINDTAPETVYAIGEAQLAHEKWAVETISRNNTEMWLVGVGTTNHLCTVVNTPYFQTECGHRLLEINPDIEIAVLTRFDIENSKWIVSLRSRKGGPRCDKISEQFGGGGHPCAAGWNSKNLDMFKSAKNRNTEQKTDL